jgi:hypothetical protein
VPKPERKNNSYFCLKCYFFGVQNKKILSAQYKLLPPYGTSFAAFWREFCHLMKQFFLPNGTSFAALWPSTKKTGHSTKVCCFF